MNDRFEERGAGPAVMEVDRLLREFYQAEMPQPWPRLRLPASANRRLASRYSRYFTRLALAAVVALALLGYWALAGLFPQQGATGLPIPNKGPEIMHNPGHHLKHHLSPLEQQRTPAGSEAQLFEENTPGGIGISGIGPSTSKGPR